MRYLRWNLRRELFRGRARAERRPLVTQCRRPGPDVVDASLASTPHVDHVHPAVRRFARDHDPGGSTRARSVAMYYAVRDLVRYDPYRIELSEAGIRASTVLSNGFGWCVPKAALLAALCRACGIPARLGYADVRNHLSTARLRESLGTDLFVWHGYTDILIDGRWVKATPAFNIELCDRFGLLPLEFDGREDSIYHSYDRAGNRHMEYVRMRGTFDDVPLDLIARDFAQVYPGLLARIADMSNASFSADVAAEAQRAPKSGSGSDSL